MEVLDIVDENDRVVGQMDRDTVHAQHLRHRSAGVLVFRNERYDELLIQRRGATLRIAPGKWADVAGHVPAGTTPRETAARELHEEMFHEKPLPPLELEELHTFFKDADDDPEFRTTFRTVYDGPFSIQPGEVDDWMWIPFAELEEDMQRNPAKYSGTFHRVMQEYLARR